MEKPKLRDSRKSWVSKPLLTPFDAKTPQSSSLHSKSPNRIIKPTSPHSSQRMSTPRRSRGTTTRMPKTLPKTPKLATILPWRRLLSRGRRRTRITCPSQSPSLSPPGSQRSSRSGNRSRRTAMRQRARRKQQPALGQCSQYRSTLIQSRIGHAGTSRWETMLNGNPIPRLRSLQNRCILCLWKSRSE